MDVTAERESITKFDPEEAVYCNTLLNEIERLQAELDKYRWTPVGKGLPKKNVFCYLYMPTVNKHATYEGWYLPQERVWLTLLKSHLKTRKVTHWKLIILPEQNGKGGEQ